MLPALPVQRIRAQAQANDDRTDERPRPAPVRGIAPIDMHQGALYGGPRPEHAQQEMSMARNLAFALLSAAALLAACANPPAALPGKSEYMVVGIDNKVTWAEDGKLQLLPPGNDAVTIMDIGTDPANPKIVASLPLMNSIFGPPTNLAITPNGQLALVANSMDWAADGAAWKAVPDTKLYVIDLTTSPPKLIDTVTVGKQPSGLSINRAGNLALIANRADNSISVLSIQGKQVKLVDTVAMGEQVAHVVFTPDGTRALAGKFPGHKAALLSVDGQKVTYTKRDLAVGLWPYNLDVTPDGRLALTADNGNAGGSDGNVDTVSVIDLEAKPERVIDKVVVGDAPEGFAISPTGKLAVAVLLRGSNNAKTEFFYNRNGSIVVLKIDGKKVTKVGEVEVRGLPEGAVFSPDGRWLYVGNFMDSDLSVLRVDGDTITNTGTLIKLPGKPASMRGRTQ
jgi:DNA-binding beta-propeller fold protein YncE